MIGALGACFGRVVTMDSPRARPPGEFQWEATLWHELAHVITLQMSNQRVPRWLTEGISVYEEKRARPEWGREMDVAFAARSTRGETMKLRDLNAAFNDPKLISLAYFQASAPGRDSPRQVWARRAAQAAARLRAGDRHRRGAEGGAQHRPRSDAGRLRSDLLERRFGSLREALAPARGRSCQDAARRASAVYARRAAAQLSRCSWRWAAALSAKRAHPTAPCRRSSSARRRLIAAGETGGPNAQIAKIALDDKDPTGGRSRPAGADGGRFRQRAPSRGNWRP